MTSTALLESLRQIVGATHVLTDGDLTAYEQDWRKRSRGARPGSLWLQQHELQLEQLEQHRLYWH